MVFTPVDIVIISLIFIWIGFVRTGLGFGGAVLGLPLLMLVGGSPIDWLPIIGIHLLFFFRNCTCKITKNCRLGLFKAVTAMDSACKNYWCYRSNQSSTNRNDSHCLFDNIFLCIDMDYELSNCFSWGLGKSITAYAWWLHFWNIAQWCAIISRCLYAKC